MHESMEIAAQFDARAKTYGAWFEKSLGTKYLDRMEKETLLEILKPLKGKGIKLAEIGPGKGRLADYLIKHLSIKKYTAAEISPKMVDELKKRKIPRLEIIQTDGSKFHIKEKVDAVISVRQIKYNNEYVEQLERMRVSLKRGGVAIIEFPSCFSISGLRKLIIGGEEVLFNPFKLKGQLRKAGFVNISMRALRFLPDNSYVRSNNKVVLSLIKLSERFLGLALPYWFGKSIVSIAKV